MPYGNNLTRRRLGNTSQYHEDKQEAMGGDTIDGFIKLGIVAALGIGLYRTGALEPLMKPMLEVADSLAREGGERASVTMSTIKQWSNSLRPMSAAEFAASTQKYNPGQYSIFRQSTLKDRAGMLLDDIADLTNGRRMKNLRNILQDTRHDLDILHTMIKENADELPIKRMNMDNTDLAFHLRTLRNTSRTVSQYGQKSEEMFYRSTYMSELVKELSLTDEMKAAQLKRDGYRTLTLGDVLEKVDGKLQHKAGTPYNLDSKHTQNGHSFLENINEMVNKSFNRYRNEDGKLVSLMAGDWENIIIDKEIKIDEAGRIIDYRMTKEAGLGFINSLANDFKLPVVQFNPFKVLLGAGRLGTWTPFAAYLSPDQLMPSLTGMGGSEYTLGRWLADNLGEEYAKSGISVINGKAYVKELSEDSMGRMIQVADDLVLTDITRAEGFRGLSRSINGERIMAGLDMGHAYKAPAGLSGKEAWEDYKNFIQQNFPDIDTNSFTKAQEIKYRVARHLDMGFQESYLSANGEIERFDEITSIDAWTDKFTNWLTSKSAFRMTGYEYDTVEDMMRETVANGTGGLRNSLGYGFLPYVDKNKNVITPHMYYAQKKGFSVMNIIDAVKSQDKDAIIESTKHYIGQYFSGRDPVTNQMGQYFNRNSTKLWGIFNTLSEKLGASSHLLGLSTDSKANLGEITKNLLIKRALPVYGLLQVPGMINYFSEPFLGKDKDGQQDNIGRWLMRRVSKIDVGAHKVLDFVGATRFFKFMGEMTPGSDQINEWPVIYQLGLGQTAEERKDYIENGNDPIRKGRYWGSGNTPFTGGKIMYFRPNIYRRVQADVKFSDSLWGSRQEYYNNTWYPNPVNPLAPVNHFITNRHHYDYKHYYDRPYLETAPEGGGIPIIGPMFESTIGSIIMHPKKMHMEYWRQASQESAAGLTTYGTGYTNYEYDTTTYNNIQQRAKASGDANAYMLYATANQARAVTSRKMTASNGVTYQERTILPIRTYDRYDNPFEVYNTPSGNLTVVDVPDELNLYNVNKDLQRYSINKVIGTNQRVDLIDEFQGPGVPIGNNHTSVDNAFMYSIGENYNWMGNIAGLKGFALQQFVTGHGNEQARVIENSGYAYGWNRAFWNMNPGGLGGNLSETTRRFIQDRNKNTDYVNPIRNTMPNWIPGDDYFDDFKHGDPYTKVLNGEERLPGEGYERLHHINMNMNIGSSYLGYSREDIKRHLLHQDGYRSTFEQDTLDKGTSIHKQIERYWKDIGFAFSTEGKIDDKRNGIIGYYDAMVHDASSPTGVGIVDIKTTSAKNLEKIRASGKPLPHHQKQVNYYLWGTQNTRSNGYVFYVDKEDVTNNYMVGFKYDKRLLKESMNNLYGARRDIKEGMANGTIGRGELYSPLDRFRILADVAPYSQEYRDAATQLSNEKLTPEQQAEATRIRDQVSRQKEPLRVYDYKFRTANLKSETVTVSKVLDNNTFVTKEYGKEHAIKFAGIGVTGDNSTLYKSHKETYTDKAGRKRKRKVGMTMAEAASKELHRYIRPGMRVTIQYDADEHNKFSKDSSRSIRAVVKSRGRNVNKHMLNKGFAVEKENDNSPAGVNARYSKGEIAFGSSMEWLTHHAANVPFFGNKFMQVRSPYEQYRDREVYGKDFQSWNTPITGMLQPMIEKNVANSHGRLGGIAMGAFIGSFFGNNPFGRLVGATVGASIPAIGGLLTAPQYTKDRDWRPKRRRKQEELNEYIDTLKYVKNMRLYEKYKSKALHEDHFDVERFIKSKEYEGARNKLKARELKDYKRKVKLDFKHRGRYNFKYGSPKYATGDMNLDETISAINKEIGEIQGNRKVTKLPSNALLAIQFKQQADKTMYAYEPGDSLVNIMSALPKKERQYFKHFMNAPEEEKAKILRIAPNYLRRALQSTWGLKVDPKPSLGEYFQSHALPDVNWVGWDENVDIENVKTKMVMDNRLDPGEFDIWPDDKKEADAVNIPIPKLETDNNWHMVQTRLRQLLGNSGYDNIQMSFVHSNMKNNSTKLIVKRDGRDDVERQIDNMQF